MAKILTVDELLDIAFEVLPEPEYERLIKQHEEAAQQLANRVAQRLGVIAGVFDFQSGQLAGPLLPAEPGQQCPEEIERADPGGDWEVI